MLNTMKPLGAQSEKHQIPKEITIFLKQSKSMLQALKMLQSFYFWWNMFSTSLKSKSQKNFDITNIPFLSVNKFWYAPFQNFKSLHIKSQLSMLLLTFCEIRKTTQLKKKVFLPCHILYFFLWQCKDHKASSPNISRSIAHIELFGKARDTA